MFLEYAEASFKCMEHRFRQLRGLACVKRVLQEYALANDVGLQFGDVPIGLVKMLLFPGAIHGFAGNPRGQLHWARAGPYHGGEGLPASAATENPWGCGGASVSTARAACQASASAGVTAITSCSLSTPAFFGQRDR